jgi:pimeloyl-ACP methyl ester carboxylesterase
VETQVVSTSRGPVEVSLTGPASGDVVLVFPGGHCSAATPVGSDLYTSRGLRVLSFSRPGYGHTAVGPLTAAEFVPAVAQVCDVLGIRASAATVGISFGGLQAAHVAAALPRLAPRLVLHSCAPSTLSYPDARLEALAGPLAFSTRAEGTTWRALRALTSSDRGLRLMMATLSTLPVRSWWPAWGAAERDSARATFHAMGSGSGFVTDLGQGTPERSSYRRALLGSVACPTLVTASRHDGGVGFGHALDLLDCVPGARLVETDAPSHFYWLGPQRPALSRVIHDFLAE